MDYKIVFSFSPRCGCRVILQQFFQLVGLLCDAKRYNRWNHHYQETNFLFNEYIQDECHYIIHNKIKYQKNKKHISNLKNGFTIK